MSLQGTGSILLSSLDRLALGVFDEDVSIETENISKLIHCSKLLHSVQNYLVSRKGIGVYTGA